jgi:hypothetical protein
MKTKPIFLPIFLCILTVFQFAVERIKLSKPVEFEKLLEKNNVFLKMCLSFDAADGYFYFLDTKYGIIFKVEEKTGKLVKTISSEGQGPFELQNATAIRVIKNKIFVLDSGFNGIKIFDTEGNPVNEFKLNVVIGMGMGNFDVNDKEEIFLGRFDSQDKTLVKVFNVKGKKLRSMAPVKNDKNINQLSSSWYYYIRLDKDDNLYVLFHLMRKLAKYDKKGKLIWERKIKNELLDKYPDDYELRRGSESTIRMRTYILCIDTTPRGNIIVGHMGGGCMFSGSGELKRLITLDNGFEIRRVKVYKDRLINLSLFGEKICIYQYKEE